jgi:predicted Zn-dependent protease
MKRILLLLILPSFIFSCTTVPGIGRSQFAPIPAGQMLSMSINQYAKVIKTAKISKDQKTTAMVRRVGQKIATAVEDLLREEGIKMDFEWEFNLIDDKQANAWCMPGGKIAVYTGILKYTVDETGLAVVMGHEVAHAVARHGNERMTRALGISLVGMGLGFALNGNQHAGIFLAAFGAGANFGIQMPFGRSQESEADRLGLLLMARAGYNPEKSVDFWSRMSAGSKNTTPEFLSTHPSHETRIADLEKYMPDALLYYFPTLRAPSIVPYE